MRETKRIDLRIRMQGFDHSMKRVVKRQGPRPRHRSRFVGTIKGRVDAARIAADLTIQELELRAGEPGLYTMHVFPDAYILGNTGGLSYAIKARKQRIWQAIERMAPFLKVTADYLWGKNPKT